VVLEPKVKRVSLLRVMRIVDEAKVKVLLRVRKVKRLKVRMKEVDQRVKVLREKVMQKAQRR
jgi:hypothetical protein